MPHPNQAFLDRFNRENPPAKAPSDDTVDHYHGVEVADPYRPLEDLDAPETDAWTTAQEERFKRFVAGVDGQDKMKTHLSGIWEFPRESLPRRCGERYFSSYNDGVSAQSIYQVRDSLEGEPRTLLNPNQWSEDGTVSLSGVFPSPDGTLVAYLTSKAGSDAQTLRIRDVATGKDLPDVIERCRFTSLSWDRDSEQGFNYTYPTFDANDPGDTQDRRFVTKHHTLGQTISDDPLVFEAVAQNSNAAVLGRMRNEKGKWSQYELGYVRVGTNSSNALYIRQHGSKEPFELLLDDGKSVFSPVAEVDGKLLVETNHGAPWGKLVLVDPANPQPENWQTVVAETPLKKLEHAFIQQGKLFVSYMDDTATKVQVHDLTGKHLHDVPVPEQVSGGFGSMQPEDTELLFSAGGFQSVGTQYKYDIASNTLDIWKESQAEFDLKDAIVERVTATSKDGTEVPMTIIRGKDTKLDGSAATLMYGYGGFNNALTPGIGFSLYNWVKEGGIYVQTNLRGGGEFGQEWYDGGRLLNKQNTFDDFAACGEYLIENGYTQPARLAIQGGSNGGLLTLATALQRPELFGAVISQVPVTDMLRFDRHTFGAAWRSDYGHPSENQEDFEYNMTYSPLHNVEEGKKYPPILVKTADHDDRVVPSHAFKFVATMQEKSPETVCVMHCVKQAGHGAGQSKEQSIDGMVNVYAFLEQALGPIQQEKYKKAVTERGNRMDRPQRPANDHPRIRSGEPEEGKGRA